MSDKNVRTAMAREVAGRRTRRLVIAGTIAVVVVAAVFAIGITGGGSGGPTGDGTDGTSVTTTTSGGGSTGPGEFQPVRIDGVDLVPLGEAAPDAAIGLEAPILRGFNSAHQPVTIDAAASGTPTMIVFLAHWCPHCNREVPRLLEWKSRGLVPENLRVVGITTGSRSDLPNWPPSSWLAKFEWPWEVLADSGAQDAARAYGVDGYPFMVLVDGNGKVAHRMSGEVEVDELARIIDDALGLN